MTGQSYQHNFARSELVNNMNARDYGQVLRSICLAFASCVLLCGRTTAAQLPHEVTRFALCSENIRSIVLTKVPGNNVKWEFVITLNRAGAKQFRDLEHSRPSQLVDVVWDGVSFGKRPLDLPIRPDATKVILGSKWLDYEEGERTFSLLNKNLLHTRNLNAPCGATSSDEKEK